MNRIDVEQMRNLAREGFNANKIALHFGVQRSAVTKSAKKHSILLKVYDTRKIDLDRLKELAEGKATYETIAIEFKVTLGAVAKAIKKHIPNYIPNHVRQNPRKVARMQRMLRNGIPIKCIAEIMKTTVWAVRCAVYRTGVSTKQNKVGPPVPEAELWAYAKRVKSVAIRATPLALDEIDGAIVTTLLAMQELPATDYWKRTFSKIFRFKLKNEYRNRVGRTGRKTAYTIDAVPLDGIDVAESNDTSTAEFLREKIENLPSLYRKLLYTYLQTGDHRTTWEKLKWSEANYHARLRKAKRLLREEIGDELEEFGITPGITGVHENDSGEPGR